MPKMVRKENDIVQKLTFKSIQQRREKEYVVDIESTIDKAISFSAKCVVYVL
jgi:hypothetical protein